MPTRFSLANTVARLPEAACALLLACGVVSGQTATNVVNVGGQVLNVGTVAPLPPVTQLVNLSIRGTLGPDEHLITGFALAGSSTSNVLMRATGPSLINFGVSSVMANPALRVFDGTGALLAENDDWPGAEGPAVVQAISAAVGAFSLTSNSRDAATVVALSPGTYTLLVAGSTSADRGDVLAEIYTAQSTTVIRTEDAMPGLPLPLPPLVSPIAEPPAAGDEPPPVQPTRLVNLSARGRIDSVKGLIAGFAVVGAQPKRFLIRVAGPVLETYGVLDAAPNPRLSVTTSSGTPLAENDDWDADPATGAEIMEAAAKSGGFPFAPDSRDAAVVVSLAQGNYTAIAHDATGLGGTALIEIYEIQDQE